MKHGISDRRLSKRLTAIGHPVSEERLHAMSTGSPATKAEEDALRALIRQDNADIARYKRQIRQLNALKSILWRTALVGVFLLVGALLVIYAGDVFGSLGWLPA